MDSSECIIGKKRKYEEIEKEEKLQHVQYLLNKKRNLNTILYGIEKNIRLLKKEIDDIDNELYQSCPHEWVRDWDAYEPCGPTPKICKHCNL